MKCPVCEDQLRPIERNGVEIEMCPTCKGVWLDRGELDTLLASGASADERGQSDRERNERGDDEKRRPAEGKRKSGGLLGNLMDTFGGGGD
jgi:Zn-finger nucleic acid-binding protein